jgi:hypothetical protein
MGLYKLYADAGYIRLSEGALKATIFRSDLIKQT